jgi:hypothetical protein
MNVEKISEELGRIEQFIQLFQACYTQTLGQKPDEKTQLQVLGTTGKILTCASKNRKSQPKPSRRPARNAALECSKRRAITQSNFHHCKRPSKPCIKHKQNPK